jgi:hypothetical protein
MSRLVGGGGDAGGNALALVALPGNGAAMPFSSKPATVRGELR